MGGRNIHFYLLCKYTKTIRIRLFLKQNFMQKVFPCLALQVVPRGSLDGEVVNKRRATVAHEAGNECPN